MILSDIKPVGDFHLGGWSLVCGWTTALSGFIVSLSVLRGTLVCIWEEFSRKGLPAPLAPPYPPAPQVCLPITSLLVDGISSNLAHIFSSPGKNF